MKDLRKDEHFQRLAETGRRVWTLLESCIQDRIQSRGLENLIPDFEVMLRRKRQGIFLRPYLSRLFLEVVGEEYLWRSARCAGWHYIRSSHAALPSMRTA